MWSWPANDIGPPVLLFDTFTGADGTLLTAHTPEVGGPWLVGSQPSMRIEGNRANAFNVQKGNKLALGTIYCHLSCKFQFPDPTPGNWLSVVLGVGGVDGYIEFDIQKGAFLGLTYADLVGNQGSNLTTGYVGDADVHQLDLISVPAGLFLIMDGVVRLQLANYGGLVISGTTLDIECTANTGENIFLEDLKITAL